MNNNLTNINQGTQFDIFNYKNLGSVRCYISQDGQKWFCHIDVCSILGIMNPSDSLNRLDRGGVVSTEVIDNLGRTQQANFINEGNLFRLITGSRKPEAREFTNWVCDTVLPSLMNKGYYTMDPNSLVQNPTQFVNMVGQAFIAINQQFSQIDENFAAVNNTLENHTQGISDLHVTMEEIQRVQRQVIETGYLTIRGFAIYHNLNVSTDEAQRLGHIASDICRERGILTGTEPDQRWGYVNTYPYKLLCEVYANNGSNNQN